MKQTEIERLVTHEIRILSLVKGREWFIFRYSADQEKELIRIFGRYANDPAAGQDRGA